MYTINTTCTCIKLPVASEKGTASSAFSESTTACPTASSVHSKGLYFGCIAL